jgi:hypothetical protein
MLHIRAGDCNPHLKSRPGIPLIERRPGQWRHAVQATAARPADSDPKPKLK